MQNVNQGYLLGSIIIGRCFLSSGGAGGEEETRSSFKSRVEKENF